MNKPNLLKLANFLEEEVHGKKEFCMHIYSSGDNRSKDPKEICGAVAGALGYSVLVIPPVEEDYIVWEHFPGQLPVLVFQYWKYSERVFQLNPDESEWCFFSNWKHIDNTALGAAKRIRHLVEKGLPDDWEDQMLGKSKYLFS